jgi:hypothetical protein
MAQAPLTETRQANGGRTVTNKNKRTSNCRIHLGVIDLSQAVLPPEFLNSEVPRV